MMGVATVLLGYHLRDAAGFYQEHQVKKMSVLCIVFGHRWRIICYSDRTDLMKDLHPMAGMLATCTRCDDRWDDLPGVRPSKSGRDRLGL